MKKLITNSLIKLAVIAIFCTPLFASAETTQQDDSKRKMVWAHVVRWGFFQLSYDEAGSIQDVYNPATDRTLLGKLTQERKSFWGNAKAQIESAMKYGVDGFCINLVDPKSYMNTGSFLQAAEGTDFKIALCMDNYVNRPADYCITHLGNYLRAYYDHPNQARIDGKPVIFIYNAGMNMANWAKVVDALKEQGLEAYYIHRSSMEWTLSVSDQAIADSLAVNNGIYDFGCCGFTRKQIDERVKKMTAALDKNRPDGVMVASTVCGYLGRAVGNYRPFFGSKSFIDGWETIINNPRVNWACVTTWNDYTESTHIEPSAINRDALAILNREYARLWKSLPYPSRPAQPILSYHEEVLAGHDWTIEVLNFPYNCGDYAVDIEIIDTADNKPIKKFVVALPKDKIFAKSFRLAHSEMRNGTLFRVIAKVINKNPGKLGTFATTNGFVQLYPVTRRFEVLESQRTVRIPLNELSSLKVNLALADNKLNATMHTWEVGGKLELFRNGFLVEERDFQLNGKGTCVASFDLAKFERSPYDVYILRYSDVSGNMAFSNPVAITDQNSPAVAQKVIITNSDFEEDWPLHPNRKQARLATMQTKESMIYKLCYNLTEGEGKIARSSTAWKLPLMLGEAGRGYKVTSKTCPVWVNVPGRDGKERPCLQFFGETVATLPVRSMPSGIFTIEAVISANAPTKDAVLIGEQRPFAIFIQPSGKIKVDYLTPYGNASLVSDKAIEFNKWTHVALVNSGNKLELFIDGVSVGSQDIKVQTMTVNSHPALGNLSRQNVNGYNGLVAGFAIAGTALTPDNFQLEFK